MTTKESSLQYLYKPKEISIMHQREKKRVKKAILQTSIKSFGARKCSCKSFIFELMK